MRLPYTSETIVSPDGIACAVLKTDKISFAGAKKGRKSAETLVRCAKGGEEIITRNKEGLIETVYTAQPGDAIFVNLHDMKDIYCPGNLDGSRWKFSELKDRGYLILGDDAANGGVRVKNAASFSILHEAVESPVCIKDAWGEGKHQFLFPGATLKLNDDGRVTGIDKSSFDATWEVLPGPSNTPSPASGRGNCALVRS